MLVKRAIASYCLSKTIRHYVGVEFENHCLDLVNSTQRSKKGHVTFLCSAEDNLVLSQDAPKTEC